MFVFLRTESGIVKFTQRLSLKDKHCKEDRSLSARPPAYRRRSLSVDWYHNIYINSINQSAKKQFARCWPDIRAQKMPEKLCWLWAPLVSRGFSSAHLYRHHDSSSDCLSALHPPRLSRLMHVQNSQIWLTSNMLFLGAFPEIINMHIVLKAHESLCLFFFTV